MEECRSALKILTVNATGWRPFRRPWRRLEGNIKMVLKEIGIRGIELIKLRIDMIRELL